VTAQLDSALDAAALSAPERRTVERFVAALQGELGEDLRAVWLYGSRARGERPHPESDVDLLVIAEGGHERYSRLAMDLSAQAAYAEDESPFAYSVHVHDPDWLRGRREIESFFIAEVDRDKLVLAGSALE
jgi:predicted nucleotidyltransferase